MPTLNCKVVFYPIMPEDLLDYDSLRNSFRIKHIFTKYLKESCTFGIGFDQNCYFKYSFRSALVKNISLNSDFVCYISLNI